jgi:hypothetical protein
VNSLLREKVYFPRTCQRVWVEDTTAAFVSPSIRIRECDKIRNALTAFLLVRFFLEKHFHQSDGNDIVHSISLRSPEPSVTRKPSQFLKCCSACLLSTGVLILGSSQPSRRFFIKRASAEHFLRAERPLSWLYVFHVWK